jgi:hypothetical protein
MKSLNTLLLLLTISLSAFPQEDKGQVIVKNKVEVVEYDYDYLYFEFFSSFSFSANYPIPSLPGQPSLRQQFFEEGRNERMGFDFGYTQGITLGQVSFSLGLFFQQYNEYFSCFEYNTQKVTIQEQDGSLRELTIATGDPVPWADNNRLNYIKVPFELTYSPKWLSKPIGLRATINYHYLLSANYHAQFSIVEPVNPLSEELFSNSYYSLGGSAFYQFILSKNTSLQLEPYFQYSFNPLIKTEELSFGINALGVRVNCIFNY